MGTPPRRSRAQDAQEELERRHRRQEAKRLRELRAEEEGRRVAALEVVKEGARKLVRSRRGALPGEEYCVYEVPVELADGTAGAVWDVVREGPGSWAGGDDYDDRPQEARRFFTLASAVNEYEREP